MEQCLSTIRSAAEVSMTELCLHVEGVSHRYGTHVALTDVSFDVPSGQLFGLLGPNGSGKTTLFRLLATLLPLQDGNVAVCNVDLAKNPSAIRRLLGVTFQSPAVDVRLTVEENLECHGAIYGISSGNLRERIGKLLDRFELNDRRRSIVGDLSGGLRRRVELVKGLLHNPRLLLLDEPSTGLDPGARRQFWELIQKQQVEHGTTVIVTTHLMEEAELCENLLLLDKGRVVATGTPHDLQTSLQGQRLTIRARNNTEVRAGLEAFLHTEALLTGDRLSFRLDDAASRLQEVMQEFGDNILSVEVAQPSLEDVFLEKTGHTLTASEEFEQ